MFGLLSKIGSILGVASVIRLLTRATPKTSTPLSATTRLGPNAKNGFYPKSPSTIPPVKTGLLVGGIAATALFIKENKNALVLLGAAMGIISIFTKNKDK